MSEIPYQSIEESVDTDNNDLQSIIKNPPTLDRSRSGLIKNSDIEGVEEEPVEANIRATSEIRMPKATIEVHSERKNELAYAEGSPETDQKKKKKKKVSKAAGKNGFKDQDADIIQTDTDKDHMITELDSILKKRDNVLASIFDVLENNFISEEIYVDKKRHYSKYVYISNINSKGAK